MTIIFNDGINQTVFNGTLYLVRNAWYSAEYLGAGKTEKEAIVDMNKTIKKHKLQPRDEPYF